MTTTTHESNVPSTPNVAASSVVASDQTAPAAVSAYARRQTLRRTLISEWVKIRTLRNTWVLLGALVVLLVGLGALAAQVSTGSSDQGPGDGNPISTVLVGANFAVLLAGIMGSLAGAREFASRMITATVAAVPRRWQIVTSSWDSLLQYLPSAAASTFTEVMGAGRESATGARTCANTHRSFCGLGVKRVTIECLARVLRGQGTY